MTVYSDIPAVVAPPEVSLTEPPVACRQWLAALADLLIPASGKMPAASSVGVAEHQLDVVLGARPDLLPDLLRAWAISEDAEPEAALAIVRDLDSAAYDAVRIAVAGGYYAHPQVRRLLGYTGQQPQVVRVDQVPEYVEEGLLERVVERGPVHRDA